MRHCQNQSGNYPTGYDLSIRRRLGEADRAKRIEEQRARIADVALAVMIWIVTPLVSAALAIGLVWLGVCWLRSH